MEYSMIPIELLMQFLIARTIQFNEIEIGAFGFSFPFNL